MQRPETKARARALQLLYAWDVSGAPPFARVVARLVAAYHPPPDCVRRAADLASRAAEGCAAFDARIAEAAEHWRLDRVGIVERNILRLALAELAEGATPPKVVIDEAVKLAHWFAGAKAPQFVNGILDRLARASGSL